MRILSTVMLSLALVFTAACGASPLQVTAITTDVAGQAINTAGGEILHARGLEETAAAQSGTTEAEATAAVAAVVAKWAPIVAAEEVAAVAQNVVADAIVAVAAGRSTLDTVLALLPALLTAYSELAMALAPVNITLPALPGGLS